MTSVSISLGLPGFRQYGTAPLYAGRAPGFAGLDQVNVQLRPDTPEGCHVPVTVGYFLVNQRATVSVSKDGGPCRDSPDAVIAAFRWTRRVTEGPAAGARTEDESFRGWIVRAPENLLQVGDPMSPSEPEEGPWRGYLSEPGDGDVLRGCPIPGVFHHSAGPVTITDAQRRTTVVNPGSGQHYAARLSPGAIRPGVLQIAASGADVGAFSTSLTVPPPIQVTTRLQPGTTLRPAGFELRWDGGEPGAIVRARLLRRDPEGLSTVAIATRPATARSLMLGSATPFRSAEEAEIFISYEPAANAIATFIADMLSRGGSHLWQHQFRFQGLRIGFE